MTLSSITLEKTIPLGGGVRMLIYRAVDDGSGGTLSAGVNHILDAKVTDLTRAVWISAIWTEDSEDITVGSEGTASDVLIITVLGWGG